jgi:class 3 adenylate cyclase
VYYPVDTRRAVIIPTGASGVTNIPSMPSDLPQLPGERRQVTVLFADMVGFTAISERLGEEGTYTLIRMIYELMAGAVKEQGGSVKDFTGDGIMALFGVPNALEDAPLRACRAGLLIHEALAATEFARKYGVRPQMRIGINSGLAIVTQIREESTSMTALGDTINLASRLQTLAEPGTVFLSEATNRLVQGMVETSFGGTHAIKGKAEPQNVYRLDSIRRGATRFDAAVGRGLSAYAGRESELDILARGLVEASRQLQVFDVMAEPGMGKSRLLHEFRERIGQGNERPVILSGSCSPDGQHTPFLSFIQVVRSSFQVSVGEPEKDVVRKLEMGLTVLGLHSLQNLGLLLNLLGLKPPEKALDGLDGLLVGLRTRELLHQLLEARCRLSTVVLIVEDLHWTDSVSEEVLRTIVNGETKLRLLLLHTRRPEYEPAWLDRPTVAKLHLEPLPAGDIRRLVQGRLGVEILPEALVRLVTEKAEGNALFAEEIVSFLSERGMLRAAGGKLEFDDSTVGAALPASVQTLLTARVDRLAPQDRALLQAAAVIGRRFERELLAGLIDEGGDIAVRLAAMQALDLIHLHGRSGDYSFKHALVRDALYQSLLTGPRTALHLKIAEQTERRGGNRLAEVVEILAHHYSLTDRTNKAFTYFAMAGAKSLGVYSLEEADKYFAAAITLLNENSACANDEQVAELLVNYTLCSNLALRLETTTAIVQQFMSRLDRSGDSHNSVLVQHQYVLALLWSGQFQEAARAQTNLHEMAIRLNDVSSRAYALASSIHVSTIVAPLPVEIFEAISREAIISASSANDVHLQIFVRNLIGWEEFHRGRIGRAHQAAEELMALGQRMNDPRSTGLGMTLKAWVALLSDDYVAALNFAETSISIASTPFDREGAKNAKIGAMVLLRRPAAFPMLRDWMDQCAANSWNWYLTGADGMWGVALVLGGEIGHGIRWMEQSILKREDEGYRAAADWYRMNLCEIYLEIISGNEWPSAKVLVQNLVTLLVAMFAAETRVSKLVERVRQNPQFDKNGHHIGRCEMILGVLYKIKKKRVLAIRHLTEARRIVSQFGPTPMLVRIDAALAELVVA